MALTKQTNFPPKKETPKSAPQEVQKRGRGRPRKNMGPPKDKIYLIDTARKRIAKVVDNINDIIESLPEE